LRFYLDAGLVGRAALLDLLQFSCGRQMRRYSFLTFNASQTTIHTLFMKLKPTATIDPSPTGMYFNNFLKSIRIHSDIFHAASKKTN